MFIHGPEIVARARIEFLLQYPDVDSFVGLVDEGNARTGCPSEEPRPMMGDCIAKRFLASYGRIDDLKRLKRNGGWCLRHPLLSKKQVWATPNLSPHNMSFWAQ